MTSSRIRSWSAALAAVGLAVSLITVPSAAVSANEEPSSDLVPIEELDQLLPRVEGTHRFMVDPLERQGITLGGSHLYRESYRAPRPPVPDDGGWYYCTSYQSEGCKGQPLRFHVTLPPCDEEITSGCVAGLGVKQNGRALKASFDRALDFRGSLPQAEDVASSINWPTDGARYRVIPRRDFRGVPAKGLPPGGRASLWQIPGITDDNSRFLVETVIGGLREKDGRVIYQTFSTHVMPVVKATGPLSEGGVGTTAPAILEKVIPGETRDFYVTHLGVRNANGTHCRVVETDTCWLPAQLPPDLRIKVDLHLDRRVSGWLHGRMEFPVVKRTPIDQFTNRLVVEGDPVTVPAMIQDVPSAGLPRWANNGSIGEIKGWRFDPMYGFAREFRELAPFLTQRSTREYRVWRLTAMVSNQNLDPCLQSETKLVGVVTTNALMYEAQAPNFSRGKLSFQVSGLHRNPQGRPTRGNYNLLIDAKAARCLYGYSRAPVIAEVEVVDEDGEPQVASTASGERRGWLTLSARNFTFSNPKIIVELKQKTRRSGSTR